MPDTQTAPNGLLIEAESFDDLGGWVIDSQFDTQMGSPYLLAHGLGRPVDDASTTVQIAEAGEYRVWVRAKDWVPEHHPGRFAVTIDGQQLATELGANGLDWSWQDAGTVRLAAGPVAVTLHDLTGFDGRCDAIFLSRDESAPPEDPDQLRSWRRALRGVADEPADGGEFDLVVVGGGVPGSAAALVAARLGLRVALLQDRPLLGGNASVEIGLTPRGATGPLIKELSARHPNGDLMAAELIEAEPSATLLLGHNVIGAVTEGNRIVAVDARDVTTGVESRFRASSFIDCTGKALLGLHAGAETLFGKEARAEYGEALAPEERDERHHGNTVFFRTRMAEGPVPFPEVPWAVEVAKDFANLNGQLSEPGIDNVPGPVAMRPGEVPDPTIKRRMQFPATHFWEYGQDLDPYTDGEQIRDHLLRAIYGTFSNVKQIEPDEYANLELDWVAFVAAQGEYRRYVGDYVLTENDIREHTAFPDAVVRNDGAFCLHYPGHEKYDFRLKDWKWDTRDGEPYDVPFRCLYSASIDNLMMAGKHISMTHVAASSAKFMGNGGQHAIAAAAAAYLCREHSTTPRGVYESHLPELREIIARFTIAAGDAKPVSSPASS